MFFKAQTATEYLVILGVVIVIGLITVTTLTEMTGLGGGTDEKTARLTLAAQKIAITEYAVSDYDTVLTIKNNHANMVTLDSIVIDNQKCLFFYGTKNRLASGESKNIICQNVYEIDDSSVEFSVEINWTDFSNGATYSQSGDNLQIVTSVANKYLSTLSSNDYWNGSSGCWDDVADPHPICTCLDLNRINTDFTTLGWDYQLQNSIDINRCANFFSQASSLAQNWTPIGDTVSGYSGDGYNGTFDGQENMVKGVIIDGSSGLGFFGNIDEGSGRSGTIQNLGIVGVDITCTSNNCGGLASFANYATVMNSFVTGHIQGSSYVGGLVAQASNINQVSNSYFEGSINGTDRLGGLIGYSWTGDVVDSRADVIITGEDGLGAILGYGVDVSMDNAYATGTISGIDYVGGLAGFDALQTIRNVHFIGSVSGTNHIGGLFGDGESNYYYDVYADALIAGSTNVGGLVGYTTGSGLNGIQNSFWVNKSDDAFKCVGDSTDISGMDCNAVSSVSQIPGGVGAVN